LIAAAPAWQGLAVHRYRPATPPLIQFRSS
jgi:hypothetical protein